MRLNTPLIPYVDDNLASFRTSGTFAQVVVL